jgi:hypothetical protein
MNWKLVLFASVIAYGAYQHFSNKPIVHGEGAVANNQPINGKSNQAGFNVKGYSITPLETFAIEARVLSAEHYSFGREADLSPVDLALGWGKMSDEAILKDIKISQSNRFYYWRVDAFPIPRREIETQSANMHMIPADDSIASKLKSVKTGQVVKIKGFLVRADAPDGWHWRSSLTREDTGNGACEVVFVKEITVS